MAGKPYKHHRKGKAGRHVQLSERLQATEAWATLKPGPRALYIELKRRFDGKNNGRIILSHRQAATALNIHRNTVGPYFDELIERGFITMTQGAYLGPTGIGQAALWALQELPLMAGQTPQRGFEKWREQKPRTKTVPACHNDCDTSPENGRGGAETVLKIVTGG